MPLNRAYPYNTMNDLVYPVHGGMEDWGYGVSMLVSELVSQ